MHRAPVPLFFLLSTALSAQTVYQVTFRPLTAFGEPVAAHVTALADPLHRRDLASHCTAMVCTGIPEGPYRYELSLDETGRKIDGSAVVYRSNQVVAVDVGTPAAELDESEFPAITGKVVNAANPEKLWIRLQPLYSDSSVSSKVDKDGSFKVEQVRPGNWMLLVLSEGKLLHFQPLTCKEKDNAPVTVDLQTDRPLLKAQLSY